MPVEVTSSRDEAPKDPSSWFQKKHLFQRSAPSARPLELYNSPVYAMADSDLLTFEMSSYKSHDHLKPNREDGLTVEQPRAEFTEDKDSESDIGSEYSKPD